MPSKVPANTDPESLLAAAVAEAGSLATDHAEAARRGLAIAALLEEIRAEPDIRAAAVLYPLVAAGAITGEAVAKRYGAEMRRRVEELQRLGSFGLPDNWRSGTPLPQPQAETLRKMLLAIVADVRLVLVRLADQLDRLQRARAAAPELRERIATETREIFAPLANRLGIWYFKWQMEDLAFRYLEPETYRGIADYLKQTRQDREARIEEVLRILRAELQQAGIRGEIEGRPKHIYSIWRKMQRKRVGIEQVFDISAVRVLVDTVPECYAVLGQVHSLWPYVAGEFDDYIANPKGNFYRSLHTAVLGPGREPLEVQIRTREMHEHAELGVAAHWRYKEGGRGDPAFEQKIAWLRQLLAPGEEGEADRDLLDQLRTEIFEDRVYAFTPAGDVVDMPAGATPLDFAYQVHTNVGHHCRGARVNGRMVPLTHSLKNGDKVEILTAKNAHPSRDWLLPQAGYLASPRSRSKVRAWFRQQDQDQNRRSGRQTLEKELGRLGLDVSLDAVAARFGLQGQEQLWLAIGAGDLTLPAVIAACEREAPAPEPSVTEEVQVKARRPAYTEAAVSISGVGDLMTNFARCCRPLPPEPIAGYITQGRGVSIHRATCKNLLRLQAEHPERLMSVDWGQREHASYPVEIEVLAWDRTGLIRDVSALLADEKIDINAMTTRTDRSSHQATIDITAGIDSLEHLSRLLHRVGRLPNVISVRRKA
ncbi:MAG: bifunctional (p)ppGpp synthetase/guanosine-3',5'-bis(diphosphate) 3'-pyrophosphohydrolase [Gammaproteobacteria bacterium]|jgi:GTP pyrophosphokinase